jgi:GNAT superfamily N-acetyltransferase
MNLPASTEADPEDHSGSCRSGEISLGQMTGKDLPAAMELKSLAGWNQTEADWRRCLALYPAGCVVARIESRAVGTVVTADYGPQFLWISMMLVHPEFRRKGIGRCLMEQALANARSCLLIGLDATPFGKPLYAQLGFEECYTIQRMVNPQIPALDEALGEVRVARELEWPDFFELDREIFGADRSALLSWLVKERPDAVFALHRGGRLAGACLVRKGSNFTQVGPVIAEALADAQSLVTAAVKRLVGQPVVIDVPGQQAAFAQWLGIVGFVSQRPLWRMFHGQSRLVGDLSRQFAIAGPDLG